MPPDVLVGYMYYAQTITCLHSLICVKLFQLLINVSVKKLTQVWHARVLSVAVTSFADHVYLIVS